MHVVVNGRDMDLDAGKTVAALVSDFRLQPRFVAVEVNRELVPRRNFEATQLKDGDQVEIVTLVGGG